MRWSALAGVAVMAMAVMASGVGAAARSSLEGQGYTDIVVGISPRLDESRADEIIMAVKNAVNETSHMLFKATGNRLFFKRVKILVPSTWKTVTIDQVAIKETFEESHIRVDKMNPVYGEQVYTEQPSMCGEPGRYIHVTQEYLTNRISHITLGSTGKVLTQAFAKLRWGIFDEIGYANDPQFPLFYRDRKDGSVKPNYCTDVELEGEYHDEYLNKECTYKDGLPDENCRFYPQRDQKITSSLMSFNQVNSVQNFCDDDTASVTKHNSEAPNPHNLMCEGQSVWDVMLAHEDFKGVTRLPGNHPVSPEVLVVQQTAASFALVLDYSTSMNGTKISVLSNSAKRWLLHDVADGSFVTIIKFSDSAKVERSLTEISNNTRQSLANSITTNPKGFTCIGGGLLDAIEEMKNQNNKVILLITDGDENRDPRIKDVMNSVVNSKARVITISYGRKAEQTLETLAQNTGGKAYIVPDNDNGSFMDDAFQGSLTYQPGKSVTNTNIRIYEWSGVTSGTISNTYGTFIVDRTVGRNLEFRLSTGGSVPGNPYLTSPSGEQFSDSEFSSNINLWIIKLGDRTAEVGTWKWTKPSSGKTSDIEVTVTAQARDQNTPPIMTESWINTATDFVDASKQRVVVYAKVTQGGNAVVGATVKGYITTPDNTAAGIELDLRDDGQYADVQANDGTYSRYFTQFNSNGRYAVKAQVWDEGTAFINNGFIPSKRRRRSAVNTNRFHARSRRSSDVLVIPDYCCGSFVPYDPDTAVPTGRFVRNVAAGSFNVVKMPASGDTFPPGQIRDLTISINRTSINDTSPAVASSITLTWTAPGDDYDAGVVSGYEIWMSTNATSLGNDVDVDNAKNLLDVATSSSMTELLEESGQKISITLELEEALQSETLYFFVVRAVDEAGNKGSMSRPVDFAFSPPASGGISISDGLTLPTIALLTIACIHVY